MNKLEQDIYDLAMYKIACWDVGMEKDAIAFAPISSPAVTNRVLNGPGKPGFFQRIGQGFKNLGNKVRGFFGGGNTQNNFIPKKVTNTNEIARTNKYKVNPEFERHPLDIEDRNNFGGEISYTLHTNELPIHGNGVYRDSPKPFRDPEKFVEVFKSRARTNPESVYGSRPLNDPIFNMSKEEHWFNAGKGRGLRGSRLTQSTVSAPDQKGYRKEILEPYMDTYKEFSDRDFNRQIDNLKNMSEQEYQQWFNNEPMKAIVSSDKWYGRQPVNPRLDTRMNNEINTRINKNLSDSAKASQWYLDSLNFLNNSAAEIARSKGNPYTPIQPNRERLYTPQSF